MKNLILFSLILLFSMSACNKIKPKCKVYDTMDDALGKKESKQESEELENKKGKVKKSQLRSKKKKIREKRLISLNPYQLKIKPIVGSRQDDAKVIIDAGKVLKVWIAPYKSGMTVIAAHDLYSMVQKPQFIIGEMVPTNKKKGGAVTATDDFPFAFRDEELDKKTRHGNFNNEEMKHYYNNIYKAQANKDVTTERNNKATQEFDETIKNFLNKK